MENVPLDVQKQLQKYVLNFVIRMQHRHGGRFWRTEMVFVGNPVAKVQKAKPRQVSYISQEVGAQDSLSEVVDSLVQEWQQIVHLFEIVDSLEDYLSNETLNISDMIDIKTYSFRELVLEYGPGHLSTVKVAWNSPAQKFQLIFGGNKVVRF